MTPTVPVGVPATLVAGTTWKWSDAYGDFPAADGWVLVYSLVGPASGQIVTTARATDFLATATASQSAAFTAGLYRWTALATKAGETYVAATGTIDVAPNPAVTTGSDQRSFAATQLAAVEREIAARFGTASTPVGSAHEAYTIGGRSITKIPIGELQTMRARLSAEVACERNGGVLPPYEVCFARPR